MERVVKEGHWYTMHIFGKFTDENGDLLSLEKSLNDLLALPGTYRSAGKPKVWRSVREIKFRDLKEDRTDLCIRSLWKLTPEELIELKEYLLQTTLQNLEFIITKQKGSGAFTISGSGEFEYEGFFEERQQWSENNSNFLTITWIDKVTNEVKTEMYDTHGYWLPDLEEGYRGYIDVFLAQQTSGTVREKIYTVLQKSRLETLQDNLVRLLGLLPVQFTQVDPLGNILKETVTLDWYNLSEESRKELKDLQLFISRCSFSYYICYEFSDPAHRLIQDQVTQIRTIRPSIA